MADDEQSIDMDEEEEEMEGEDEAPPEDAQSSTSKPAEDKAEPSQAAEASVKDTEPSQASVKDAEPSQASVKDAEPSQASVKDAEPSQASVKDAEPSQASVKDAEPSQASVKDVVKDVEPSQASVKDAEPSQASVKDAEPSQASVKDAEPSQASVKDAEPSQASVKDAELSQTSVKDAEPSQESVKQTEKSQASVKDAEPSQASVNDADVSQTSMKQTEKSQASVKDAEPSQASMKQTEKSQESVKDAEGSQAAGLQEAKSNTSGSMAKEKSQASVKQSEQSQTSVKPSEKSQSSIGKRDEESDEPPELSSPEGADREAEGSKAGDVEGSRGGNAEGSKAGDAEGSRGGDAEGSKAGDAEGSRGGDAGGSRGGDVEGSRGGEQSEKTEPEPEPEPSYVEPLGEATEEELSKNEVKPFILEKMFHEGSMGRFDHSNVEKIQMGEGGSTQYENHEWQLEKMYRKVPEDMFMGKVNPKPEALKYEEEKFILGKLFRDLQEEDYGYLPTAENQESQLDLCDALEVNQFPQEPAPCRPPPMPEPEEEEVQDTCATTKISSSTGKVFEFSYGGKMAVSVDSTLQTGNGNSGGAPIMKVASTQQQPLVPPMKPSQLLGDPCEESIPVTTVASVVQSKGDICSTGNRQCKNKLKCDSNVKAVCEAARTAMAIYDTVTGCDNYPCNEGDRPEKEMENIEDGVWPWLYQLIFKLTPVDNNDNQITSMNDDPSMDMDDRSPYDI